MNSCLYTGHIRHIRHLPVTNGFRYRIFMLCLDLGELDTVFAGRWFWSTQSMNLAFLRRRDHFGDPGLSIDAAVRQCVSEKTGRRPEGPIRMVTHLRYFGYCFNPATFYYCYEPGGGQLEYVVVEVHNTPWGEVHCYVLDAQASDAFRDAGDGQLYRLKKEFHVSPFLPMDIDYLWSFTAPGEKLRAHMVDMHQGEKVFEAELDLDRSAITGPALARVLLGYPVMTLKVTLGIYWQALRLWLKGAQFYAHP